MTSKERMNIVFSENIPDKVPFFFTIYSSENGESLLDILNRRDYYGR